MPGDEKPSEQFDAALGTALRAADSAARPDCPAADVLASYYDRTMNRVDRRPVEAHLADCARCASTLAMMARADTAARASERAEHPRAAWFWLTRVVAPASAAGVAIALAIVLRGAQRPHPQVLAMAARRAAAPARREAMPVPPAETYRPLPEAAHGQASKLEGGAPSAQASAETREAVARNETSPEVAQPPQPPEQAKPKQAEQSQQPAVQALAKAAPPPALKKEEAAPAAPAAQNSTPAAASTAPSPALADLESRAPSSAPSAAAPEAPPIEEKEQAATESTLGSMNRPSSAALPPAPVAGAAVGGTAGAAGGGVGSLQKGEVASAPQALHEAAATGAPQIYSPDHRVAWQIGAGGTVMRWTADGGWRAQRSGVSTDLVAGSAPSDLVCWLAGKSGTVVRTTDGGENWELVAAPTTQNLSQIEAKDADNASVVAADGARFVTHDGGATWSSP